MTEIFESQINTDTFVRTVFFIVMSDNGPDTVVSWKKTKLDTLKDHYEFVDKEMNRLPRFIAI